MKKLCIFFLKLQRQMEHTFAFKMTIEGTERNFFLFRSKKDFLILIHKKFRKSETFLISSFFIDDVAFVIF